MKIVFLFLSSFFLCISLGNAQETTIKHTVEKGDTVFQLSKTYNVTPEEIYALNPSAMDIIKIGEVLFFPKTQSQNQSQPSVSSSDTIPSSVSPNTTTYAVVYGDTKFSLARRFGITIQEFERQNPHTKNGLQAGHILKIEGQRKTKVLNDVTIVKTHLVLKGETLWGISKANGLTVEQLVNANSDILSGILQIGQVLKIPAPSDGSDSNSDIYLVQKGDTKYGLSKKYDVTIAELEQTNPQIIRMLMAGQTLQIPNTATAEKNAQVVIPDILEENPVEVTSIEEPSNEKQEDSIVLTTKVANPTAIPSDEIIVSKEQAQFEEVEDGDNVTYDDYEIQPKETLYGLSKKAEMSISDFVTLNPQLANGVQMGMIVKMPINNSNQSNPEVNKDPINKKSNTRYIDLTQSIKTVKKNQILLFLPFSDTQFETEYAKHTNFNEVSDDFIRAHLEFYRGSRIAQDSARALGLDFDITILETKATNRNTKAAVLAKEYTLRNYDALLMPFYQNDIEEVATLDHFKNTPVITVAPPVLEQNLKNIYNSVPSLNLKRNVLLDYMMSKEGNLIVVYDVDREESKSYISNYAPNTKFIEVSKKGTFDTDEFESLLEKGKTNYVILESEKNSVILSTTNLLLGQLSNYSIQLALLDTSLIPDTNEVSKKRFVILQLIYPSLTPLNAPSIASNFIEAYEKNYTIEPTKNVKFGFDLTFDTLLRISQEKNFEASAKTDITEYTILKFEYNLNKSGRYDNMGIYILQYNSDGTIKELK